MRRKMGSDSAILTSVGSSFHHCGARTEKSCGPCRSTRRTFERRGNQSPRGSRPKWSGRGVGLDHSLEVRGSCSIHSPIGKHQGLKLNASRYRKPVERTEKDSCVGEPGAVEHQASCSFLNQLQRFNGPLSVKGILCNFKPKF